MTTTTAKGIQMSKQYAVIVNEDGVHVTHRYISEARLLDGLVTFGGIHVRGTRRDPIVSYKEETHIPTQDEITCGGRFGCE